MSKLSHDKIEWPYPIGVEDDDKADKEWYSDITAEIEGDEKYSDCVIIKPGQRLPKGFKISEPKKEEEQDNPCKFLYCLIKTDQDDCFEDSKSRFRMVLREHSGKFRDVPFKAKNYYFPHASNSSLRKLGLLNRENFKKNVMKKKIDIPEKYGDEGKFDLFACFIDPGILEKIVSAQEEREAKAAEKNASKLWSRNNTLNQLDEKKKAAKEAEIDEEAVEESRKMKRDSIKDLPKEVPEKKKQSVKIQKKKKVEVEKSDSDSDQDEMDVEDKESEEPKEKVTKKRKVVEESSKETKRSKNTDVIVECYEKAKQKCPNILGDDFGIDEINTTKDFGKKWSEKDGEFQDTMLTIFSAAKFYPELLQALAPPAKPEAPKPVEKKKKKKIEIDF